MRCAFNCTAHFLYPDVRNFDDVKSQGNTRRGETERKINMSKAEGVEQTDICIACNWRALTVGFLKYPAPLVVLIIHDRAVELIMRQSTL